MSLNNIGRLLLQPQEAAMMSFYVFKISSAAPAHKSTCWEPRCKLAIDGGKVFLACKPAKGLSPPSAPSKRPPVDSNPGRERKGEEGGQEQGERKRGGV